ncbi:MAG: oligosaccharide flippase family protein, partial [Paramuribaculum sp.]|nr:oligosaccharide flippase family protein [Paramuribaculum sp.]
MAAEERQMKMRVAGTLKWNMFDKLSTQVLYAITGVILARVLSQADFGLIGAITIFQTFASLFIEGGFSYALVQRKAPTDADYSSVFWFNMGVGAALYLLLFALAPMIPAWFEGAQELVPMSRVMFITFIINNASLVQLSIRMKRMNMKMVAVANSLALIAGAVVGITMALTGWGAWALVWQAVAVSSVKTAVLWISSDWRPSLTFSWSIIGSYFRVGGGMLAQSFLNTLFLNLYSFFIGNRAGLVSLGYYTQADKWSKMGV